MGKTFFFNHFIYMKKMSNIVKFDKSDLITTLVIHFVCYATLYSLTYKARYTWKMIPENHFWKRKSHKQSII